MKFLPRSVLARCLVASLGSEPVTAGPSVDSKRAGCVLGHVIGSSRLPRLLQKSKATPGPALKASRFWAAGVGDHITRAQKSWEPEKPCRVLPLVTGGGIGRGKSTRRSSGTAGWRIGA